jgi:small subunit ribosomal protein S17
MSEKPQKNKRTLQGKVVSSKMDKTIVVLIERKVKHPVYKKYINRSTKIHAHDMNNECKEGYEVVIAESRPISKTKHWKLEKVVSRPEGSTVGDETDKSVGEE